MKVLPSAVTLKFYDPINYSLITHEVSLEYLTGCAYIYIWVVNLQPPKKIKV
jgi:hypothetical protein